MEKRTDSHKWVERIIVIILFIGLGLLITTVFSPWRPILPEQYGTPGRIYDYLGRIGLIVTLAIALVLIKRMRNPENYSQLMLGFLIMAGAVTLDWICAHYLIYYLHTEETAPIGWAMKKLNECFVIVGAVILFTRLSGQTFGSIYIQKGNIKQGLLIGSILFIAAAAGSVPMANLMFNAKDLALARIQPWIPWILIYVLANAAMEEILFRGLFLRKLQPFLGKFFSNFLIAFVFTFLHGTVNYAADQFIFAVIVFPLALLWGYLMQKTEGVWGSILFHAGMDIPIMLGIFSNL